MERDALIDTPTHSTKAYRKWEFYIEILYFRLKNLGPVPRRVAKCSFFNMTRIAFSGAFCPKSKDKHSDTYIGRHTGWAADDLKC